MIGRRSKCLFLSQPYPPFGHHLFIFHSENSTHSAISKHMLLFLILFSNSVIRRFEVLQGTWDLHCEVGFYATGWMDDGGVKIARDEA